MLRKGQKCTNNSFVTYLLRVDLFKAAMASSMETSSDDGLHAVWLLIDMIINSHDYWRIWEKTTREIKDAESMMTDNVIQE